MGKQWVKQEVKRNELQDAVDAAIKWVLGNRQTAAAAAGTIGAACLAAAGLVYHSRSRQAAAWDRLSVAENYAYAGRPDMTLQQLKELDSDFASTKAAGLGALMEGDILYRQGSYKAAADAYAAILEKGDAKILPWALADLAVAQEASGQASQAVAAAQRFLETYPDHFLAPQVHACLARSFQAAGQIDQAKQAFQKMVLQYPETPWAGWAQAKLQPPAPPAK